MPLPEELDPDESIKTKQITDRTVSTELNQFSRNGSFISFKDRVFKFKLKKKETPFIPNKLKTVNTGVIVYQPKFFD